ncbi:hypothetical protein, partial [Gordonia paraffinivorans]|uniref:hypothetical protein n=1 Tax=Gordonia paraffinivorans TaxID=175628 RepID=UPI001B357C89
MPTKATQRAVRRLGELVDEGRRQVIARFAEDRRAATAVARGAPVAAGVEIHESRCVAGRKRAVVADRHDPAAPLAQARRAQRRRRRIEMVGRLVEQEQIGVGRRQPGEHVNEGHRRRRRRAAATAM